MWVVLGPLPCHDMQYLLLDTCQNGDSLVELHRPEFLPNFDLSFLNPWKYSRNLNLSPRDKPFSRFYNKRTKIQKYRFLLDTMHNHI